MTEDLQDEREFEGLRIVNPFRSPPANTREKMASYGTVAPRRRKSAGGIGPRRRRRTQG